MCIISAKGEEGEVRGSAGDCIAFSKVNRIELKSNKSESTSRMEGHWYSNMLCAVVIHNCEIVEMISFSMSMVPV